MRLLVFSDIHGNQYTMEKFYDLLPNIEYDKIIFCGDIFGYYYGQEKVFNILCEIKDLIWIKGNHDEYFLKLVENELSNDYYVKNYGQSYSGISDKYSIEIYNEIKNKATYYEFITPEGKKIGIFHGTPEYPLEGRLYPDNMISESNQYYEKYDIVILGHTHCRMIKDCNGTLIVNSGSLGQPRDGNDFGYAIIDTIKNEVSFFGIAIDTKDLYEEIDKNDPNLKKLKEVLEREKNENFSNCN